MSSFIILHHILELEYIASGDSSDGKILWVEVLDSTGTQNFENVESALFECGDSNFIETTALPVSVL